MKMFSGIVLVSLFMVASANAADVKTPLACAVGAPSGPGFQLAIKNSTAKTLTTDTIVNVDLKWTRPGLSTPGDVNECFVPDAPLAAGATIQHVTKLDRDQNPVSCTAYLSSDHPSVIYANGGSETDCD